MKTLQKRLNYIPNELINQLARERATSTLKIIIPQHASFSLTKTIASSMNNRTVRTRLKIDSDQFSLKVFGKYSTSQINFHIKIKQSQKHNINTKNRTQLMGNNPQ